ncbi:hypothetical protein KY284_027376 [Solanum tuberosum]|nr:hypothetical protein KY284_027376 [Solanum tuberosum]
MMQTQVTRIITQHLVDPVEHLESVGESICIPKDSFCFAFSNSLILGKVGAKNQNDATDKGTDVEQYQGDAREIINAKFQSKSNKEEHQQLVPDDNSGEGRDSRNNLGVVRDATVDRAVANSFEEATTFNSNNEENLENKGKLIEAARLGVGKDGVLGSPNVVAAKQDYSIAENSNNEWTLVSHKKNGVSKS